MFAWAEQDKCQDLVMWRNLNFCTHSARPLRKLKKSCFALDQLYIELKAKSLFTTTSNVFSFKIQCWQLLAGSWHYSLHRLLNSADKRIQNYYFLDFVKYLLCSSGVQGWLKVWGLEASNIRPRTKNWPLAFRSTLQSKMPSTFSFSISCLLEGAPIVWKVPRNYCYIPDHLYNT